jgi:uncharacterized protein (TIGR03067 family)
MRLALALLLTAGTLLAAPVPKELRKKDDRAAIVGTWRTVRHDGRAENANTWFRFEADGTLRTWHGQHPNSSQSWTWALADPTATPKRATLAQVGGAKYECLYELAGDTLKIGFVMNANAGLPTRVELHPAIQLYEMTRDPSAK